MSDKAQEMHVQPFERDGFKWNRLEEQAIVAAEKAKPSSDAAFWAKRSCKHCFGRGVTGQIRIKMQGNTLINGQLCSCAKRNFVKWRDEFCAKYIEEHRTATEDPSKSAILESRVLVDKVP